MRIQIEFKWTIVFLSLCMLCANIVQLIKTLYNAALFMSIVPKNVSFCTCIKILAFKSAFMINNIVLVLSLEVLPTRNSDIYVIYLLLVQFSEIQYFPCFIIFYRIRLLILIPGIFYPGRDLRWWLIDLVYLSSNWSVPIYNYTYYTINKYNISCSVYSLSLKSILHFSVL